MDNKISFQLPSLPPSINTLYEPEFRGSRMVGMKLRDGALRWRQNILQNGYIPRFPITEGSTLRIDLEFVYDWNKRRFDCSNLIKLIQDTIAYRLGFNDRIVRHGSWYSINSTDFEYVSVTLQEIVREES